VKLAGLAVFTRLRHRFAVAPRSPRSPRVRAITVGVLRALATGDHRWACGSP